MAFQRVKQYKDLELCYDSGSTLTVTFYTDINAGVQQNGVTYTAKSLTFPASSGRRTETLPLDTTGVYPEGTLHKIKITSSGTFRLFGGILRSRQIGTYMNGANGEYWDSSEQGVGI